VPAGIFAAGEHVSLVKPPRRRSSADIASTRAGSITAPMQATVIAEKVQVRYSLMPRDIVCVLEAMKMEQPTVTSFESVVSSLCVQGGDASGGATF